MPSCRSDHATPPPPRRRCRAPRRLRPPAPNACRRAATFPTAAAPSIGATRFDPQRSCSFVGRAGVAVLLVGGDRLVLDAVVRRQVPGAQSHQCGREAHQADRCLSRASVRASARGGERIAWPREGRAGHCTERGRCPARQARGGSARLTSGITATASASLVRPRTPGIASGRRHPARFGTRGHLDPAVAIANGGRPGVGPVPAGRCAAPSPEAELLGAFLPSQQSLLNQIGTEACRQSEVLNRHALVGTADERRGLEQAHGLLGGRNCTRCSPGTPRETSANRRSRVK